MSKRKLILLICCIFGLIFITGVYRYKKIIKLNPITLMDVESVNRVGGLPSSRWKVLFSSKDYSAIQKIITLVNSANKTGFNAKDYGGGKVGYPVSIEIKLKNNINWRVSPLYKVTFRTLENRQEERIATPYKDRVQLEVENGKKRISYTLFSDQLADYVLKGADQDMPHVIEFSITPDIIKPGQTVTISGDGSTKDYIEIYITDGNSASNEKYLIAKVPTNFGAWKWEGTISGRIIRTLDGRDVKLTKNRYYFETTVAGGMIDFSK